MLKIKHYEGESFAFYQEVVNSKRNTKSKPRLKQDLNEIEGTQSACFESYDAAFRSNRLEFSEAARYTENDMDNLRSLYNYRSKKIQELKVFLTAHPTHREHILNTCQNCTINEADTMDHILGQSAFPEFSVHPKNLFPCCTVCNKKKSDQYVDEHGSQLFLNLYLDALPKSQYLYVEFGENWLPRFWLEQSEDIPDDVFRLIKSHYQKLDLLNRFRDSSNEIICNLRYTIKYFGRDGIGDKIEEICNELQPVFGYNHRQVVLIRALARSEEFILECLE